MTTQGLADGGGPRLDDGPIRQAVATSADHAVAAEELYRGLAQPDLALVLLFCSPEYRSDAFARGLRSRFGDALVVGCTSAGEIGPSGYIDNSVCGISFARPAFEAAAVRLGPLHDFELAACTDAVAGLRRELRRRTPARARNHAALVLIDGLSRREEALMSCLGCALPDMPVFGASAGGKLDFARTGVLADGQFHDDSAVLVLLATEHAVRPFRDQHFESSAIKMVVTGADPARRVVTEINAEPAVLEYARIIGYEVERLTPMVFATHPLVVRLGGAEYVRSIQKANPDGSLTFFGAIDEGLVLTLAVGRDLRLGLAALFERIRGEIGPPDAVLGFDCVLRRLEAERTQIKPEIGSLLRANRVVGFSTFGEQYGSMHVNQTFTGIAIGRAPERRR